MEVTMVCLFTMWTQEGVTPSYNGFCMAKCQMDTVCALITVGPCYDFEVRSLVVIGGIESTANTAYFGVIIHAFSVRFVMDVYIQSTGRRSRV